MKENLLGTINAKSIFADGQTNYTNVSIKLDGINLSKATDVKVMISFNWVEVAPPGWGDDGYDHPNWSQSGYDTKEFTIHLNQSDKSINWNKTVSASHYPASSCWNHIYSISVRIYTEKGFSLTGKDYYSGLSYNIETNPNAGPGRPH